jgi:SNF2 family DNA or RNA helicase
VETIGNRRVLLVLDESTKVKNRSSNNYKAIYWFLNRHLRKAHKETRAWGLTATPLEKDWEDVFNQLRLLWPASMPTVKDFESRYVRYRNERGKPFYHEDRMHEFAAICQPYMLRRRKTDAELIDQFPKMIEDVRTIEMGDIQRRFYEMVEEIGFPEDAEEPEPGMHIVMRQIAGHPSSLLYSKGVFAQILVEELGADYIRSIPSAKTEALVEDLLPLVKGQGAKVLVFTFFGRSVLPLLAQALRAKKIQVWEHHGGMTGLQQETARREFKAFDGAGVLLSSDAGAKGINMAEATYVREYESALTFSQRTQRLNRIHRIDSTAVTTNATTYILEGTVEENLAVGMIERNEQTDTLFNDEADGGEHFITAEERRINLRIARSRKSTRRKKKVA